MKTRPVLAGIVGTLLGLACVAGRGRAADADRYDRFFDRVKPLLSSRCVSCHGPDQVRGGLRLDSAEALRRGGDSGPVVTPGDPDHSSLWLAVRGALPDHPGKRMPPKQPLSDKEIDDLAAWIRDGAVWPSPAQVLFEDEPAVMAALPEGGGQARLEAKDQAGGRAALAVTGQRMAAKVGGWSFRVRENPGPGEYRYVRFAWKKRGGGAVYLELANNGRWRADGKQRNAAWVAGPNTSGWDAYPVADTAPEEWAVVTRDLWADRGDWDDFVVTGLCLTAVDGGEALLSGVILGPTRESLDAYAPGRGLPAFAPSGPAARVGDAWTDPKNPVVQLFKGKRLDLWSLKKPARPAEPAVKAEQWARNPIDRFVLAGLEAKGLAPSPEADRRTLIRRLSFDLVGLPPTPEEVDAFVKDADPAAYEKLVDRLLASPHYGERWGRHWLDVVRYADTNGYERDELRPDAWRYRDYVIRAFNDDKPFDRFVTEQLAGDELAAGPPRTAADVDRWVATGFLRLGPYDSTTAIFEGENKARHDLMTDLANTTGLAFLGLTVGCCQCHDHKYDPLSQQDNYRLRAFFAAVKPDDAFVIDPPEVHAKRQAARKAFEELRDQARALLEAGRATVVAGRKAKLPADVVQLLDSDPKTRDEETKKRLKPFLKELEVKDEEAAAALPDEDREAYRQLGRLAAEAEARLPKDATALVMTDSGRSAPATFVLFQGDYRQTRQEVPPGFPSVFDPNPAAVPAPPTPTTGRRSALARWVASPDNPLTARVIVNRLWQEHFGRGVVATPNDFGHTGARPTHPELLDWLATELVAHGWSLKHVQRLMVTSAAYRQASLDDPERRRLDPDDALLWRQRPQRLDAEALRDALLSVTGRLLPDAGGPPRWPPVPEEVLAGNPVIAEARAGRVDGRLEDYYAEPVEKTDVRSVYLVQKRSVVYTFLQPFDLPDSAVPCGCRSATVVAPQALALLNSPEAARLAKAFADRLMADCGPDPAKQVDRAFRLALGRDPDAAERDLMVGMLGRNAAKHKAAGADDPARAALVDLCRAVMNLNEFAYVD